MSELTVEKEIAGARREMNVNNLITIKINQQQNKAELRNSLKKKRNGFTVPSMFTRLLLKLATSSTSIGVSMRSVNLY